MKYSIFFVLLLILNGCIQHTPAPENVPAEKKPPGIETLVYRPVTNAVQAQSPGEIEKAQEPLVHPVGKPDSAEKASSVSKMPEDSGTLSAESAVQKAAKSTIASSEPALESKSVKKKPPKKAKVKKKSKKEKAAVVPKKEKAQKIIIGGVERVRLIPGNVIINARIDTGAKTTSINAVDIQSFERDGKKWVRFRLAKSEKAFVVEKPVVREVQIKRHGEESQNRYVVKMRIILGDVSQVVEVSLTDRSKFEHKVLIGRNFLRDIYIVDVGTKMSSKPMKYEK